MGWTQDQEKAIQRCGHNIIVSAGAGSGKTAVLSERVLEFVKKGYKMNNNLPMIEKEKRGFRKIIKDAVEIIKSCL